MVVQANRHVQLDLVPDRFCGGVHA
jgi:hypothetical protein